MVSFLNHIASIQYERGLTCGAVYPLFNYLHIIGHQCLHGSLVILSSEGWVVRVLHCHKLLRLQVHTVQDIPGQHMQQLLNTLDYFL